MTLPEILQRLREEEPILPVSVLNVKNVIADPMSSIYRHNATRARLLAVCDALEDICLQLNPIESYLTDEGYKQITNKLAAALKL